MKNLTLADHTRIELLIGEGGVFRGFGDIRVGDALGQPAGGGYGFQTLNVANWSGMLCFSQTGEQGGFFTREPGIPDWWRRNLAIFNEAEPFMRGTRRLLPNRAGVVWHSDGGRCVWTFTAAELTVAAGEKVEAMHGAAAVTADGKARLTSPGVYRIRCW